MPVALLITTDLGGNVPPVLGIGRELAARGWTVVVHADGDVVTRAATAGFETVSARTGVTYDPRARRNLVQSLRDVPRLWSDRVRGRDAVAAAQRIGADVAVVDVLLVGALAELQAAGVRTVVVAHSTWEGVRTFLGGPLGLRLRALGTAPFPLVAGADRVLVATDARLGRPVPQPANAVTTGPVLEEVPQARTGAMSGRPRVLLSLSTVAFPGQRAALQRILDALAGLPVEVLASTGGIEDAAGLEAGANTSLSPRLDHAALLPGSALIVSHGGHATVVRALAHGVPMLLVPMHPLMDQPRIARAVAAMGAGIVEPEVRHTPSPPSRHGAPPAGRPVLGGRCGHRLGARRGGRRRPRRRRDHGGRGAGGQLRSVRLQASSEPSSDEVSSSK